MWKNFQSSVTAYKVGPLRRLRQKNFAYNLCFHCEQTMSKFQTTIPPLGMKGSELWRAHKNLLQLAQTKVDLIAEYENTSFPRGIKKKNYKL